MATKADLKISVIEALEDHGGTSSLIDVARHIWKNHKADLKASGDLFCRWQYDMRWAATTLRQEGKMREGWALSR